MKRLYKTSACLFLLAIILSGCAVVTTFTETIDLTNDIQEEFGTDGDMSISFTYGSKDGDSVKIEWENSTTFSADDPQAEEKAKELAQFVYDHYEGIDEFDNVRIVFIESRNVAIISASRSASFIYDVDELANGE